MGKRIRKDVLKERKKSYERPLLCEREMSRLTLRMEEKDQGRKQRRNSRRGREARITSAARRTFYFGGKMSRPSSEGRGGECPKKTSQGENRAEWRRFHGMRRQRPGQSRLGELWGRVEACSLEEES